MTVPVKLKTIVAPAFEPIDNTSAKLLLRITATDDDSYLKTLVTTARTRIEEYLGRYVCQRTVQASWDTMPGAAEPIRNIPVASGAAGALLPVDPRFLYPTAPLELPRAAPLQSLTSLTWYSDSDAATVVSSSTYHVDDFAEPAKIVLKLGQAWPTQGTVRTTNGLIAQYVCGWVQASDIPGDIVHAVRQVVRALYDDEDDVLAEARKTLAPYRITRL